jgi:hypothetical protein
MPRFQKEPSEYTEKVVALNRVSKTVKGGRVMKFAALVVVGDQKGKVGYGLGKAAEVPEAIRKGLEAAKKNMITVSLSGTTIPSRDDRCCRCRPRADEARSSRYRRDRRRRSPCRRRGSRHQGYPYQVPALQQCEQRGCRCF